tara:strand:+ start:678 stop:1646 length:969 start_codon:yes stop_codon:yes gene_type:complete
MRSITKLIDQVRAQTENEEVSDFVGIKDQEFIQYLNDAQYNLQAQIVHQHPRVFIKEEIISAVSGQEKYDLPSDCFLKNKVHNVEYSPTGAEDDYYVIEEDTIKYRNPGVTGNPVKYIRLSGQLLLTPQPQGFGKIRINYVKRLPELDKRCARVKTQATIATSGLINIELDNDTLTTEVDSILQHDYICIVDKEGKRIFSNLEISEISYDPATNLNRDPIAATYITVIGKSATSEDTVTIPAGSFIVGGRDTSTHSQLDTSVERYLIQYAAWKILKRDSSVDSGEAIQELQLMATEIIKSYAMISDDVQFIPQLNAWDDWSS